MYQIYRNIALVLFGTLFISNIQLSQSLNFQHYSTDDGLPQSTVYDIVQDSLGFIWFGTEAGVGRFDGLKVKTYSLADGLVGNNIWTLFIDKIGGLWIGTNSGLSILFEEEITNYTVDKGLPDDFIYGITDDIDGNIWVATRYGGACKFEGSKIIKFNQDNGFPSNNLSSIYKDRKGNVWFTSFDKGIIKYNGSTFINYTIDDGLLSNKVLTIFEDSNGLIWIGTDKGVTTFNGKTFFLFSEKEGFPVEEVNVILEDSNGDIWLGLYNDGILRYDGRRVYHHSGLESNEIRSGFVDKRGDIWFGTFLGGVSRLPVNWFEIYTVNTGLTENAVYPIAEDDQGRMYFGHWNGVSVLENGKFKTITTKNGLVDNNLSSILVDSKNNIWFGTLGGVTKYSNNKYKSYSKRNGLNLDFVLKVFEDSDGFIWFGAEGGISKYDPYKDKIVAEYAEEFGFKHAGVNDIYEDKKGNLWFATHHAGVIKYDGKIFEKIDTSSGLPVNNIFSVMQDNFGNFWFGTDGAGICKYDGEKFINYTEKDGLSSDVCYFILENELDLYIGTLDGISILNNGLLEKKNELSFKYISKNEGIPAKELNQGAWYKDKKGNLWFGTQSGLIKINPNKETGYEEMPVFLSQSKVSDGTNEVDFKASEKNVFQYYQNNISFEFYSISFSKSEETTFQFKLEGIEDNWSETKEHTVTYRALPPGSYKFWVRAKNRDNIVGEAKQLSEFTIEPPFYKTWWFITVSTIIIIALFYYISHYKTQQVKKRNEALEKMVRERTKELEVEKNKADSLLHNILPSSLVNELKKSGKVRPRRFNSISILFTDFKAFTYTTSVLPPEELVNELNDIFKSFDSLLDKYGLEKLKTIGDSYMAACGIPNEVDDHAIKIVYAAIDFQKMVKERNKTAAIKWDMRLGIHSGSVVAGVVGTKKFTYDIWGDTVNIASRMESSGEPGEINISGYTYMLVRDYFECEYRGKVNTKGKGGIDMYFVKGVNRENLALQKKTIRFKEPLKQFS